MASSSSKSPVLSHSDTIILLDEESFFNDLGGACQSLALSTAGSMRTFESISMHLHTFDLQGLSPPVKPRWNSLSRVFAELVWQSRMNAETLSSRIRMFSSVAIPHMARNMRSVGHLPDKLHLLQSFMTISSEHARMSWKFAENVMKMFSSLNLFHTEFSRISSRRGTAGHSELRDLAAKFEALEGILKQLFLANGKMKGPGVSYMAYSAMRLAASSGRRLAKDRVSHQRQALSSSVLSPVANLYDQLERSQSELCHAQYAVQVSNRSNDALTTARAAVSAIVPNVMFAMESVLNFILILWSRLQTDCLEMQQWLKDTRMSSPVPQCVTAYTQTGRTIYTALADVLDLYSSSLDPSIFATHTG